MNALSFRRLAQLVIFPGLFLGLGALGLHAEIRTLTDKQGRSVKAEVTSVDGDKVTIKREDGQTFVISLANLSDEDQMAIKEQAAQDAAKPKPLAPGTITVDLSRASFKTEIRKIDVKLVEGGTVKNGMTLTEDKWGYEVSLKNHSSLPINNLRAEYMLFATVDNIHVTNDVKQGLKKKNYKTPIDVVPELGRLTFKTETISTIKSKYNGNIIAVGSGNSSSRETLYGIWIRIYQGTDLVYEDTMPASLRTTEKWGAGQ